MIIQAAQYTSEADILAAHRARRARFDAAARKVANRPKPALLASPARKMLVEWREPLWETKEMHFDAHVWALVSWKLEQSKRVKRYVTRRCDDMHVSIEQVRSMSRTRDICAARDKMVYEIKTQWPTMAWTEIGRFFGRDHSSTIVSFYRGAVASGDMTYADKVRHKHEQSKIRHKQCMESKAGAE